MESDAHQTRPAVRYRPHIWLALMFWAMAPFFGLLAFGDVSGRISEPKPSEPG